MKKNGECSLENTKQPTGKCRFIFGRWEDEIKRIKDESVDLVYTDPPYGMNYVSNIPGDLRWNKSGKSKSRFRKPILNDKPGDIGFNIFAKEMYRVMKPDSYIVLHCNEAWIIMNGRHFIDSAFTVLGLIAWNKHFSIGGDLKGSMRRNGEPILYMAKGRPMLRPLKYEVCEYSGWDFKLPHKEKTGFPTQKPRALCAQVITLMSDEGNTVLDPFSGSGTICKVAGELGRHGIGFEADKAVYDKFLADGQVASQHVDSGAEVRLP